MNQYLISGGHMSDIAGAIRTKGGASGPLKPGEMADAILNIPGGYPEPTGTISITANGTVDVKDFANANVNVPSTSPVVQPLTVTENGTFAPPSGVDGYNPVTVNVSGGGGGGSSGIDDDPDIPSTYQKVQYLDFDGASYFELPRKLQKHDLIECYVEPLILSGSQAIFGSPVSGGNRFEMYFSSSNYTTYASGMSMFSNFNDDKFATFGSGSSSAAVSVGTKYYISGLSYGNTAANNLSIGRHVDEWYKSRLYKVRLSEYLRGISTTIYFLIPCRRKSDDALGFYDVVEDTFYTNQGTGALVAGPDVT